jgi:uncharacterized protein (DUF58 family)
MSAVGEYGTLLDAVRGIRWPARRRVPGALPGAHHSRMRGIAPEFAEYRPYRQGDDPRRLDWRVLARTNRAYLRLSTDRAILPTVLVVDASASMGFPAGTLTKWACARRLAVALAAVAHAGHDPVGIVAATGTRAARLAPRSRSGVVGEIARALDASHPGGAAGLAQAFRSAAGARRVVVITDFLDDAEALITAAREHVAGGGEAHAVHVIARAELEPDTRAVTAVDPEDETIARPLVANTRAEYVAAFADWRLAIARAWRAMGAGASHTEVIDDEPIARAVRRIVAPAVVEAR